MSAGSFVRSHLTAVIITATVAFIFAVGGFLYKYVDTTGHLHDGVDLNADKIRLLQTELSDLKNIVLENKISIGVRHEYSAE